MLRLRPGSAAAGLACAGAAALLVLAAPGQARDEAPIPSLPIAVAVAPDGGRPAQDDAWIDAQIAAAERLLGAHGVHVHKASSRPIAARFARLETRRDRDALAAEAQRGFVNVMVVASLRDVDDPRLYRMGVHWRPSSTVGNKPSSAHYAIVSADALPTTLAHELGHFFGLGHTAVVNNLMSYERTSDKVFLDGKQATTIRAFARIYLRAKEIVPAPAPSP
jgi:hypothetical protein